MRKDPKERFLEKVKVAESGCHEWQSTIHRDGYGKFWHNGAIRAAHRVSYELFCGEIPKGKHILHTCDNRKCVNPEHLYAGTAKDNVRDKVERYQGMWGRMKTPFETIEKARKLYASGKYSQREVGEMLGIKQTQVSRYVRFEQRKEN